MALRILVPSARIGEDPNSSSYSPPSSSRDATMVNGNDYAALVLMAGLLEWPWPIKGRKKRRGRRDVSPSAFFLRLMQGQVYRVPLFFLSFFLWLRRWWFRPFSFTESYEGFVVAQELGFVGSRMLMPRLTAPLPNSTSLFWAWNP